MSTVKPVPANSFTTVPDSDALPGWLHNCGAFVYSATQPARCGQCWSALRNGQAYNGIWQPAYIVRGQS